MKRLYLLILTIFGFYYAGAQNPFRPLSEFQQDTLAYLKYNYGSENRETYYGKTINDFLNSSDVAYTTFKLIYNKPFGDDSEIIGVQIYLQPYEYIVSYRRNVSINGIHLKLLNPLTKENSPEFFNEFYSEFSKRYPLNERNLEFIKNLMIKSACYTTIVVI